MYWSDEILFDRPLLGVRRITSAPTGDWEAAVREREQEAREQGRSEGEKALGEQLVRQRSELATLRDGVIQSLRDAVRQVIRETEAELIQLVFESTRKIVAQLPISKELVEGVVAEALQQVEEGVEITVRLNPEDLVLLRLEQSELLQDTHESAPVRLIATNDVSRGGCLVQTHFGVIDARRETKLEHLRKSLVQ